MSLKTNQSTRKANKYIKTNDNSKVLQNRELNENVLCKLVDLWTDLIDPNHCYEIAGGLDAICTKVVYSVECR